MAKNCISLAAPTMVRIAGKDVSFIDGWHALMTRYGEICVTRGSNARTRMRLWQHFRAYIMPEPGNPFSLPHHIDYAALHLYDDVTTGNWTPRSTLVDPDCQIDYLLRNIDELTKCLPSSSWSSDNNL